MKKLLLSAAAAVAFGTQAPLAAQAKTVPGELVTITASVEAIDHGNRTVTLKGPKGNYVTIDAPSGVSGFDEMRIGDKLTATYYESLVLSVHKPGSRPRDTAEAALTQSVSRKPGATASGTSAASSSSSLWSPARSASPSAPRSAPPFLRPRPNIG